MNNFKELISNKDKSTKRLYDAMASGEAQPDRFPSIKRAILMNHFYKTIALYSSEAPKEQVKSSLLETITAFEEGFKWEGFENSYAMYDQIIWVLSLAILCEIETTDFKRIVVILKRDNARDRLIKKLVNYRLPNEIDYSTNYLQREPYAKLDFLITEVDKSSNFIKKYLDNVWYQEHDDAPWHDSHKNTKVNTFFGYWAWETAALVKILNINDENLKEQKYYPYRAVHW